MRTRRKVLSMENARECVNVVFRIVDEEREKRNKYNRRLRRRTDLLSKKKRKR